MRFGGALSTEGDPTVAVDAICADLRDQLGDETPDLAFLFFSHHHLGAIGAVSEAIRERTGARHLLGCTGESIIGAGREIERAPCLSLWAARLPGVTIRPFLVRCEQTPDGFCFPHEPSGLFDEPGENPAVILLGEPFSMPVDVYLRRFNEDCPGIPVVGGMASGAVQPDNNLLLLDGKTSTRGGVGVLLTGSYRMMTVVSQGCRPVGDPMVVTECDRNTVIKLGGRPALARVQEMYTSLSEEDRRLFQNAPHVGVVMNERRESFGPGDFLIRNLIGVDPARHAVFLSDCVRRGQTVQFHVRDGEAASRDLAELLERARAQCNGRLPGGGLVFSCNGRGTRLFGHPDHDAAAIRKAIGPIPMSGFFAQGELGPIGDRNHLHGFTASVALFCES